jgi:ABC-type transport system involved in multi-copper enzyme maturation permease subunit
MRAPKKLSPIIKIAKYTLADEVQHKSFTVIFIMCALFVLFTRGCYRGNVLVNGHWLDAEAVAWKVSKMTFHIIATGTMFVTALLSMRVLKQDRDEGMLSCILSKPIDRWQYVMGKILGLWVLSVLFMLILHCIIFLIVLMNTGAIIPEYLIASFLCSFNLLFVILTVLLLSLLMPDIAAFLCLMGIGIISFLAEGIYAIAHSQLMQGMTQQSYSYPDAGPARWTIAYYFWPKLSGTQQWASSLIGNEAFHGFGPVHPLVNILFYCLILGSFLFWKFRNTDF